MFGNVETKLRLRRVAEQVVCAFYTKSLSMFAGALERIMNVTE